MSRFNPLFSSSTCRSLRSSLTPRCASFFFYVEGGLTGPELPAEIANRGPTLRLPEGIDNLFFGES